jgi:hypothetical protein
MGYPQNAYPNAKNFSEVSFPQELTPPDIDPDEGETILVAYSPVWTKVLMASCDQMLQFQSWEGTHDQKILAVNRALALKILLQTPFEVPERDYPAPYWDDDADVDDEAPAEEQDWYGQVADANAAADEMSFTQNAVVWLLTGFVALVAAPSFVGSIAAAIAFRTLATRFVLAFNRGDVREQFRVIIDAQDYGMVDTDGMSEGDQIELEVNGLAEADFHDILLVVTNP